MADELRSFVSGTSIIIIPGVIADAVTKSNLLAQITANDQNDATDHDSWYRSYQKALSGMGWVIDQFSFQRFSVNKETVTVARMSRQVLGRMRGLSAELFSGYTTTINSLNEKMVNSTLFDKLLSNCAKEARSITHHIFQVILGYQVTDDSVTVILGLFYFNLNENTRNWMFTEIKSTEIHMSVCVQKVVLNLAIWDQVKHGVTEKIIQDAIKEVGQLE